MDYQSTKIFSLAKCKSYFSLMNLCQGQGSESLNSKDILEISCDPWDAQGPEVSLAGRPPSEPESHRIYLANGQDDILSCSGNVTG